MLLVFFVSAVFHEVAVGVPLHMVRFHAFAGIMLQVRVVSKQFRLESLKELKLKKSTGSVRPVFLVSGVAQVPVEYLINVLLLLCI